MRKSLKCGKYQFYVNQYLKLVSLILSPADTCYQWHWHTHTHIIFNWHWVNEFFGDIFAMCMDSHTHIPLPSPSHTPTQISKQECIFIQLQFIQTGSTCSNFYHTNNQLVCTISFRKKVTIMEEKKGMYHQLNSYSIVTQ